MTVLSAAFAARGILAARKPRGRIGARRSRGVPRRAVQLALKLRDPLVLARNTVLQPTDLLIHPQQHCDHNLAALIIDRLRLNAVHTDVFDTTELTPPTH